MPPSTACDIHDEEGSQRPSRFPDDGDFRRSPKHQRGEVHATEGESMIRFSAQFKTPTSRLPWKVPLVRKGQTCHTYLGLYLHSEQEQADESPNALLLLR